MNFSLAPDSDKASNNHLLAKQSKVKRSIWRHWKFWFLVAMFVPFLSGVIWFVPKLLSPFPLSEQIGINYPLFYPRHLPPGYAVDETSFQKRDKVVIFNLSTPIGRNIAVSEEAIPPGVNLSAPSNTSGALNIPNSPRLLFNTSAGPAYADLWGDKYVCSIVTPNTWIILNVSGFTSQQVQLIAQAFAR